MSDKLKYWELNMKNGTLYVGAECEYLYSNKWVNSLIVSSKHENGDLQVQYNIGKSKVIIWVPSNSPKLRFKN